MTSTAGTGMIPWVQQSSFESSKRCNRSCRRSFRSHGHNPESWPPTATIEDSIVSPALAVKQYQVRVSPVEWDSRAATLDRRR